jgi:hypothetical protein
LRGSDLSIAILALKMEKKEKIMGMKKVKKIELKSELPMIFAHQFNHKVIFFIKSACIFLKFSDNHIKF